MLKTQRFIMACLVLAAGVGLGLLMAVVFTFEIDSVPEPEPIITSLSQKQTEIEQALKAELKKREVVTDGLSPYLLLEQFPVIEEVDFNGAEAIVGQYVFTENVLSYKNGEQIDTAAASDLSEAGFALFLKNYSSRTGVNLLASSSEEIFSHIIGIATDDSVDTATSTEEFTACTMDAKVCPDGSYVGRIGPNCEFAACKNASSTPKTVTCTSEQKRAEACIEIYQPVCASVQIQCVTTPCEPIPKTFGNSCEACSENSVTEYTEGACVTE